MDTTPDSTDHTESTESTDSTDFPIRATIRPWLDPVVDADGHDPRSEYVEQYWLSVIGPTATWVMRRFSSEFERSPEGFDIDLAHTAATMGLSIRHGASSPFARAVHRLVMFGLAQPRSDGFVVRRRMPTVAHRHLKRLPADVQAAHDDYLKSIQAA